MAWNVDKGKNSRSQSVRFENDNSFSNFLNIFREDGLSVKKIIVKRLQALREDQQYALKSCSEKKIKDKSSKVGMSFENTTCREVIGLVRCSKERESDQKKGLQEGHAVACWLRSRRPGRAWKSSGGGFWGLGLLSGAEGLNFWRAQGVQLWGACEWAEGSYVLCLQGISHSSSCNFCKCANVPHVMIMKSAPTELSFHQQRLQTFPCDDLIFGAFCSICNWW